MLRLITFGGLALTSSERELPVSATQPRKLALLAVLAAAGERGMSRDKLIALFWSEASADRARHALEQLLYGTRRVLGRESIRNEGGSLRLDPSILTSDLADFDRAITEGDPLRAAELYEGSFLEGFYLSRTPEFERWVEFERARLEQRFRGVLERGARHAATRGDHRSAAELWRLLAVRDPLDTAVALELMRSLVASGNAAGAIQHGRIHTHLAGQELGAAASPEVQALVDEIARSVSGPAATEHQARPPVETAPRNVSAPAELSPPAEALARRPASPAWRARRTTVAAAALVVFIAGALSILEWKTAPLAARSTTLTSLAVLPFEHIGAGPEEDYLGPGVTEELIHELSRVPGLRVVARTSAFAARDAGLDAAELREKLGVEALLTGSVRRSGERVRIAVRLVGASTADVLWSEVYDRDITDVLALEDEVARAVVARLRPNGPAPSWGAASRRANFEAYTLYLQGRFAWNQGASGSYQRALEHFRASVAADPSFAPGHAGVADALIGLAGEEATGARQEPLLADAERAAREAIRLDPSLPEAYVALGNVHIYRWQWESAELQLRRAIEANRGFAYAYERYGMLLALRGRFDEGIAALREAQLLDPLAPRLKATTAYVLTLAGRYDEGVLETRTLLAIDSTRADAHFRLGSLLLHAGKLDDAAREFTTASRMSRRTRQNALPMLAYTHARAGRLDEARGLRAEIERALHDGEVSSYWAAAYFGAVGEADRAFHVLDHLAAEKSSCLQDLAVDPAMAPLRTDPRFVRLVEHIGALRTATASQ